MKLLWVGNLPGRLGGQNRVSLFTIRELTKLGYQVEVAGKGTQVLDEKESLPCVCYEWLEHEVEKLHKIIEQSQPQVILFSHDLWNYYIIPDLKQKYPAIKIVGWFTIDAHPIHNSWFALLRATDYICVSTKFGKDTIYQRWPEKGVEVISYGVDRNIYNLRS